MEGFWRGKMCLMQGLFVKSLFSNVAAWLIPAHLLGFGTACHSAILFCTLRFYSDSAGVDEFRSLKSETRTVRSCPFAMLLSVAQWEAKWRGETQGKTFVPALLGPEPTGVGMDCSNISSGHSSMQDVTALLAVRVAASSCRRSVSVADGSLRSVAHMRGANSWGAPRLGL